MIFKFRKLVRRRSGGLGILCFLSNELGEDIGKQLLEEFFVLSLNIQDVRRT
jgi:hypothetical protein